MTIREAVEFLHTNGILSAPVADIDVGPSEPWQKRFKGVVDMIKRELESGCGAVAVSASNDPNVF